MDIHNRLEIKMEPSTYKANVIIDKELEDELMKFTKKDVDCKLDVCMVEQTEEVQRNANMEVNVTECTKSFGTELLALEYQDATESSSSFDDTSLGVENFNPLDDSEALSDFCDDAASSPDFGGFGDRFRMRKRKPSTHWRSFIQPLMWRCKWLELQMKRLQTQAQQYDQELEAYNKQKQIQFENPALEHGVKTLPLAQDNPRCDILKRKRRRITEATTDVAAYMSRHNLFSYYENKKSSSQSTFLSNNIKNPVGAASLKVNVDDEFMANGELLSTESGDAENSFEHLLYKIYYLQSQVSKLKDRIDMVLHENAGRFPCTDNILPFNMPCDDALPSNSGERVAVRTYIASQLLSEYNTGDVLEPESAVTSHRDAPDANRHVEYGALIDNQRVKDEMNSFTEVKISPLHKDRLGNKGIKHSDEGTSHSVRSPLGVKGEPGNTTLLVLPTEDQPSSKTRSVARLTAPKGKRKRGRRKGGARWSRRSTS